MIIWSYDERKAPRQEQAQLDGCDQYCLVFKHVNNDNYGFDANMMMIWCQDNLGCEDDLKELEGIKQGSSWGDTHKEGID